MVVTAVSGVFAVVIPIVPTPARADELTIAYSAMRTGWDAAEAGLSPASVRAGDFGRLFETTLPDTTTGTPNEMYAQPIIAAGTLVVATEENEVAGLDPESGAVRWHVSLGPAWTPVNCGDLVPHIGVTSTPVYDPVTASVYVMAKVDDGPDAAHPHFRLHALDPASGAERAGWPLTIGGVGSNSGLTFTAATQNQRAGLLLLDGRVYAGFGSHCDISPYTGWIADVQLSDRSQRLWSTEGASAADGGGVWQAGGGLASDGSGRILFATGNGVSPAPGPGSSPPPTLAESVVRLAVANDGALAAQDFFSPANNAKLDQNDADLGSGGVTALPDDFGTSSHPHLLVITGKDGIVRLLDRDDLGGMGQGPGGTDAVVSSVQVKGTWGRAAAFSTGAEHYLYLLPSYSPLQALRVAPNGAGVPTLSIVGTSSSSFAYTSGSPVVTSSGTDPTTAVVWVVTCDGPTGTDGLLQAFPAIPPASAPWSPIYQVPLGTVAKFIQPATDNNRIYVGTRDGRVLAFGRPVTSGITAPTTDFSLVPVGSSATRTVTLTAGNALTVSQISATGAFAAGAASAALPVSLAQGQTLSVPVTFSPTAPGTVDGVLAVTTSSAGNPPVEYDAGLHGTGTQPGLGASPAQLTFSVPTTQAEQLGVTVQNTGTAPETITATAAPSAPFTVSGMPPVGSSLQPQQSTTVTVLFSPTASGTFTDALTITSDAGSVTVPLNGVSVVGAPVLGIAPTALDFGSVLPGWSAARGFTVRNTGNALLTITKATPPAAPFTVSTPVGEGQPLSPGDALTVTVAVRPTSNQPVTDRYEITSDDGTGPHVVSVAANTSPPVGSIPWRSGCLDITAGRSVAGTPAITYPCNGTRAQQFSAPGDGTIRFGAATSGFCLDVTRGGTASGTPVQLWNCNGTRAQQWVWRTDDSLVNPHSGKCLDVPGASSTPFTHLQLWSCNRTDAQYWNAAALARAYGQVSSAVAAQGLLCLDDRSSNTANGTAIQLWTCNLTPAQLIAHVGNTLRVVGRCVDVPAAATANRTLLQLYRCNGSVAQVWVGRSDGSVYNPHSGKCLDDPGGSIKPGVRLQIYTCNGTAAQRWLLPG